MPAKKSFFQLIEEKKPKHEILWAPDIFDCFSAACAREVGFEALTISSSEQTYSFAGCPCGLMNFEEMLMSASRIIDSTDLPVCVDGENCGGTPEAVYKNVKRFAEAGAMAISIEDTDPQSIGLSRRVGNIYGKDKKEVIPLNSRWMDAKLWATNVRAAVEAVKGTECMVIARVDSKGSDSGLFKKLFGDALGLEEAIRRAQMGVEAGAPITLIQSLSMPGGQDMWREIGQRVPGMHLFPDIMSTNGVSDVPDLRELYDMGYQVITAHGFMKAAFKGMMEYGKRLFEDKNTVYVDNDTFGYHPLVFSPIVWDGDYEERAKIFVDFYHSMENYKAK